MFFHLIFYHLNVVETLKKRLSETFSLTLIQRIFCWRSFVYLRRLSIGVPEKIHLAAHAMKVQEHPDMSNADKKSLITSILIARRIRLNCIKFVVRHIQAIGYISGCSSIFFIIKTLLERLRNVSVRDVSLTFPHHIFWQEVNFTYHLSSIRC